MDKLRPVAEVEQDMVRCTAPEKCAILQADREATVQRAVDDVVILAGKHGRSADSKLISGITAAILAVGKPLETVREQLGRKLWELQHTASWDYPVDEVKEMYCRNASVLIDELAKIKKEQKL